MAPVKEPSTDQLSTGGLLSPHKLTFDTAKIDPQWPLVATDELGWICPAADLHN